MYGALRRMQLVAVEVSAYRYLPTSPDWRSYSGQRDISDDRTVTITNSFIAKGEVVPHLLAEADNL